MSHSLNQWQGHLLSCPGQLKSNCDDVYYENEGTCTYMYFLPLKFSQYPSRPVPVPELFGKYPTRPVPKSKTSTRRTLVSIGSVDCGSGWYLVVLGQYRVYTWCYLVFVESFVCFCWELCHFSFISVWDSFIFQRFVVFCFYSLLLRDLPGFVERFNYHIALTQ